MSPLRSNRTETLSVFDRAVFNGDAYRASIRRTGVADGTETIVHIDPNTTGGNVVLETPRVNTPGRVDYDVFENADPGANLVDDLEVHNMDYDSDEAPDAVVQRVSSGGLDTTGADKTEETLLDPDNNSLSTGNGGTRNVYRNIPPTDIISLVFTNQSGGNADIGVDLTFYEGPTLPE